MLWGYPCMPPAPSVPRALVHAAAAWHRRGWTPLLIAADNGSTDAIELLAWLGANLDAQDNDG